MRTVGWILIVLGGLGAGGLLLDLARKGVEEDRLGGIGMGLLVVGLGAALVWLG